MTDGETRPGPKPKVARLIDAYDLVGIGDELEAQWTRREDRKSLRTLADQFNKRLLSSALEAASVEPLSTDIDSLYQTLNGDIGSSGQQHQLKRRLEHAGVDVETLTDEFVSYGAVRSYLTGYRNASPPETASAGDTRERDAIERLRQRTVAVTESKLERLQADGDLEVGTSRVLATVQVVCEECHTQYDVAELLEEGACNCA